jgi:hypothetical protein
MLCTRWRAQTCHGGTEEQDERKEEEKSSKESESAKQIRNEKKSMKMEGDTSITLFREGEEGEKGEEEGLTGVHS